MILAMNKGQFAKNCEKLLIHIHNLHNKKLKTCIATTEYLAKAIGKSTRQTTRYLKSLHENKLIFVSTSKLKKDKFSGKLYKTRIIIPTCEKPKNSGKILSVFFNKIFTDFKKKELTKEILDKSPQFPDLQDTDYSSNYKIIRAINKHLDADLERRIKENNMKSYLEYVEECKRLDEEAQKERYLKSIDSKAEKIFFQYYTYDIDMSEIEGETWVQKLADYMCKSNKNTEKTLYDLEPPTPEEIKEKVYFYLSGSTFRNGDFYFKFFLGGEIPYEVKLLDYVWWGKDSEYYKLLMETYNDYTKSLKS